MTEDKKTDFEKCIDFGNLYLAYRKAKSGKRKNKSCLRFQASALDGVYQIKHRLETKTYQISPYNQFTIHEPKERIIKSCTFQDKIVQHSLCDNILLPKLSSEFLPENFAGQIGKGTLYGLNHLSNQMIQAYEMHGYGCRIIKADISKFFYTIDHDILKDIVGYFIEDEEIRWMCELLIDSTDDSGLPLGNQASQVFALLYLSGLDHFITGELGVKFYGRYMDDFYMIVESKDYAKWCLESISEFCRTLKLNLNGKTQIVPFKNGIRFCGFHTYVTKDGKIIRKLLSEKKRAAKKKYRKLAKLVKQGKMSIEKYYESYNSWKNHISHGNCIKLSYEMDKYVKELLSVE